MKNKYRNMSRTRTPWDHVPFLNPMESFIKNKYLDTFSYRHPKIDTTGEVELLNSYSVEKCRNCGSANFKKYGFTKNGIQRYYCNDCKKTFNILSNTIFEGHKISITEWIEYLLDIFRYESVNITSKTNKNSYTTSKYWLNKLFMIIESLQEEIILEGNVYIDETYIPVLSDDKVIRDSKELRGLSKNQYCIGIGYDKKHVYAKVEGLGKTSKSKTYNTFNTHIKVGSHLIHDKEKSHRILIEKLNLTEDAYDAKKLKVLKNEKNPLFPINEQCRLLKLFLKAHSGFDRDDLQNYINLYCFISNPPDDKLEKVKIILERAIHITKSLRYRDYYS